MRFPLLPATFCLLLAACSGSDPDPTAPVEPAVEEPISTSTPPESLTTIEPPPESLTTVPDEVIPTTVAPSTTVTLPASSGVTAADLCNGAVLIEPTPEIDTDLLPETSGIAYSRTQADRLYAHNDSGNLPRLFGIGAASTVDFVWTVDTAMFDWEDMAVAGASIYLADIGDNLHIRPTVRVIALPEPDGESATLADLDTFSFTYTENRYDAETLIIEPDGSLGVIVTKGLDAPGTIFELPLDDPDGDAPILAPVGGLTLGLITAGDITADGAVIGLRQPNRILLWDREPGVSIAETIQQDTFCEAPSAEERQGEAFAFHADGRGYTTLSERESATRNDFRLPDS